MLDPDVIVTVSGGLVQEVEFVTEWGKAAIVEVRDFDIGAADQSDLFTETDGTQYVRSVWTKRDHNRG